MHGSTAETIAVNVLLFTALTTVGMTVDKEGFERIWVSSFFEEASSLRGIALGLAGIFIILPAFAVFILHVFGSEPGHATGLALMAIMPGGPGSAIYALLSGGCVPLNVTLTILTTALSVFMVPLLSRIVLEMYTHGQGIKIDRLHVLLTCVAITIPLGFGMFLASRYPSWRKFAELLAMGLMIVILCILMGAELLSSLSPELLILTLSVQSSGLLIGLVGGRLVGIGVANSISVGLELVVHDLPLALAIVQNSLTGNDKFLVAVQQTIIVFGLSQHMIGLSFSIAVRCLRKYGWMNPSESDMLIAAKAVGVTKEDYSAAA